MTSQQIYWLLGAPLVFLVIGLTIAASSLWPRRRK